MTDLYPVVEFKKNTYEIDIFDTGSVFLLVGDTRAMVIDTGIGIGDLKSAIEKITDKPYFVVMTHGHGDHTGGAGQFDSYYMSEKDYPLFDVVCGMDMRRGYSAIFPKKYPDRYYAYDPETDITDLHHIPERLPMTDGQVFDLGNRNIIAYECPGHTPGSMVLLDEATRTLFAGDALNKNLLIREKPGNAGFVSMERARAGLARIKDMGEKYDGIYNGHHDFRALGMPLESSVLDDALFLMDGLISGNYEAKPAPTNLPASREGAVMVEKNGVMISFCPEGIHEPTENVRR